MIFPGILVAPLETLKQPEKETKSNWLLKHDREDTEIHSFISVFWFSVMEIHKIDTNYQNFS